MMSRDDFAMLPVTIDEETRVTTIRATHGDMRGRTSRGRGRIEHVSSRTVMLPEESIVVDERTDLTPAQAVENKLLSLLKEAALPVSQLHSRDLLHSRGNA
jgi:hypothetical protein